MSTNNELFTDILKGVSRSFYLTLKILPAAIRQPIGLAYLLARGADTLSDTTAVPRAQRLHILTLFREQLTMPSPEVSVLTEIQDSVRDGLDNHHEQQLLQRLPDLFELLQAQPIEDRDKIIKVVNTLTSGMVFDLETFPMEESGEVGALATSNDLDHYTYLVAGCVGEFWTDMSVCHIAALKHWDHEHYSALGIRLGKALQLTNILRDLPRDLRIGRCYLPLESLQSFGLSVERLKYPPSNDAINHCLQHHISLAAAHYEAAMGYILGLPRRCIRLRLAALWPLLIGLESLLKLKHDAAWLDPNVICKVDRSWVYRMLGTSMLQSPSNRLIQRRIDRMLRALSS